MLVALEVANADSRAAPVDCFTKPFTIWRFSSRHGSEVSINVDYSDGDELQPHQGAYEPRKTTWTGISSKKGPVLVVHFVHPTLQSHQAQQQLRTYLGVQPWKAQGKMAAGLSSLVQPQTPIEL